MLMALLSFTIKRGTMVRSLLENQRLGRRQGPMVRQMAVAAVAVARPSLQTEAILSGTGIL